MQDKTLALPKVETISDAEVLFIELTGQQRSGFIQEGTEHLPSPIEITSPSLRRIRSTSHYFKKDKDGVPRRVDIRFIHGVEEIEVQKQIKAGFAPNPMQDVIIIKNGKMAIVREGNTIGMFDYVKKCSYNVSNPDRNPAVQECFREVVPEKEKLDLNEQAFMEAEAMTLVRKLVLEKKGDQVKYDEAKLDAYCRVFQLGGPNNASRLNGLIAIAKSMPKRFIEDVSLLEQKVVMEIVHGEELNLIRFTATTVEYVTREKIIHSFTGAFLSTEKKRERLATFFQTQEGAVAYQEYLAELEMAKKVSLS